MKKSILFGITAALGLSAGAVFADGHGSTLDVVKERGNLFVWCIHRISRFFRSR